MSLIFRKEINVYDDNNDLLGNIGAYGGDPSEFEAVFVAAEGAILNTTELREISNQIESLSE